MTKDINCEILIIGSGAGGSTAAKYLTDKGRDVVLIEEGNRFDKDNVLNSFSDVLRKAWRQGGIIPVISKSKFGFGEGKCLGGGTFINGGLMWTTPDIILDKWNKELNTTIFKKENISLNFDEVTKNLGTENLKNNINIESSDSVKLKEIGEKNKIYVAKVPKSINSDNTNKLTLGSVRKNKNSVIDKFILDSEVKGLRVITNCNAKKILTQNNLISHIEATLNNEKIYISAKKFILACGATQTPMLIKKSFGNNYLNSVLEVPLNLRIGVKFNYEINVDKELMFSRQIQEYLDDGVLIMPTSFNKSSFFASLNKLNNEDLLQIENSLNSYASFIIQLQSENHINLNNINNNIVLSYNLSSKDLIKLKKYFTKFCEFLFDTGALEMILPFNRNYILTKNMNLKDYFDQNVYQSNLEMVSVHGMSSAKMGNNKSNKTIFDIEGKSFDFKNLYSVDSSILPSSTIESPQGTIMSLSNLITKNINYN